MGSVIKGFEAYTKAPVLGTVSLGDKTSARGAGGGNGSRLASHLGPAHVPAAVKPAAKSAATSDSLGSGGRVMGNRGAAAHRPPGAGGRDDSTVSPRRPAPQGSADTLKSTIGSRALGKAQATAAARAVSPLAATSSIAHGGSAAVKAAPNKAAPNKTAANKAAASHIDNTVATEPKLHASGRVVTGKNDGPDLHHRSATRQPQHAQPQHGQPQHPSRHNTTVVATAAAAGHLGGREQGGGKGELKGELKGVKTGGGHLLVLFAACIVGLVILEDNCLRRWATNHAINILVALCSLATEYGYYPVPT